MTTVTDIGNIFERWLLSKDPIAARAATLIRTCPGGIEVATDLLAAGFSAGYVSAVRDEIEGETRVLLADFNGGRPS